MIQFVLFVCCLLTEIEQGHFVIGFLTIFNAPTPTMSFYSLHKPTSRICRIPNCAMRLRNIFIVQRYRQQHLIHNNTANAIHTNHQFRILSVVTTASETYCASTFAEKQTNSNRIWCMYIAQTWIYYVYKYNVYGELNVCIESYYLVVYVFVCASVSRLMCVRRVCVCVFSVCPLIKSKHN